MRKLLVLLTLALTACTPVITVTPVPTKIANIPSAPTIASTATATPMPPTVTPEPAMPTAPPRALPTPIGDWHDLAPYRAAMRPEFAAEVDQFTEAAQYRIDLSIAADLSGYSAVQQVRFVNRQTTALDKIYFRLFPNAPTYGGRLSINEVRLNNTPVKPSLEVGDTALRIDLVAPLEPQAAVEITLSYAAQVPTTLNDLGYNLYGVYSYTLSLANFYPLIPVYDEQGWHIEPAPPNGDAGYSETALYQVNIQTPADQVVVTSGVCETTDEGATTTWRCVSGPMRDFMIAMSADYEVESKTIGGVTVNSYFWERDKTGGRRLLQTGITSLKAFEKRMGAYPFNEMDFAETPMTAGACEYPGLMVYAVESYRDETVRADHEVAHQWLYSLVGNDQVNEPWLDEALTTFVAYLWMADVGGQAALNDAIAWRQRQYAELKGTADDRRVDLPAASYDSPRQYSRIVYSKGMLFFNALYEKMGDEKFNRFLQAYVEANRYGIAHRADLLRAIGTQIDQPTLDALLTEWITTPE